MERDSSVDADATGVADADADALREAIRLGAAEEQRVVIEIRELKKQRRGLEEQVSTQKQRRDLEEQVATLTMQIRDKKYVEFMDAVQSVPHTSGFRIPFADGTLIKFRASMVPYTKRKILPLTTRMQQKLPAELRHIIYQHYWDLVEKDTTMCTRAGDFLFRLVDPFQARQDHHCRHTTVCNFPILPLASYVGVETASEAIWTLTRVEPGRLSAISGAWEELAVDIEKLQKSLSSDIFKIGIPWGDAVAVLYIHVQDSLRLQTTVGKRSPLSRKKMANVRAQLQHLLDYHPRRDFKMYIELCWNQSYIDTERFLDLFQDVYFQLKDHVRATLSVFLTPADGYDDTEISVQDYYSLPLLEWRQKHPTLASLIEDQQAEFEAQGWDETEVVEDKFFIRFR